MANLPSQRKRNRTNEIARLRNNDIKSELKTYVKRVRSAEQDGDLLAAEAALKVASRALDKAVTKGVIHQNQAANRKSALAKQVNRMRTVSRPD